MLSDDLSIPRSGRVFVSYSVVSLRGLVLTDWLIHMSPQRMVWIPLEFTSDLEAFPDPLAFSAAWWYSVPCCGRSLLSFRAGGSPGELNASAAEAAADRVIRVLRRLWLRELLCFTWCRATVVCSRRQGESVDVCGAQC